MIYKRYVEGEEYEDWYLDPYRVWFWLTMAVILAASIALLSWPDRVALVLQEVAARILRAQLGV
jgi:hypothetical protein